VVASDPIIELRGVRKSFGRQCVLAGVDLRLERGTTTAIMGRSGTGKSVLLKHIVGLLRPDGGEVFYEGRRIDHLRERELVPIRRQVVMVFQLNALFDSMTVFDNVCFPMTETGLGRLDRPRIHAMARRCLAMVGLAGFEDKRPADLSGGEKKRCALARAICLDPPPKVILYDEPTAGLDPQRSDVIDRLIRRLKGEFQVTGIVVTHDLKLAREVGDRVLVLWDGQFIADGTPDELLQHPDPRVRRFVEGQAEPEDLAPLGD
jgi:phospholipid/cholesterol/gamma-HCH transport system ATP-binding protein